jgi:KaiC/GvpD/RAD55 family RecA-like ATPase
MPKRANSAAPLPYADVAQAVLGVIYDSLYIIYRARFEGLAEEKLIKRLIDRAEKLNSEKWARHKTANNPHVTDGIPKPSDKRPVERVYETGLNVPRISRLCLEASDNAHGLPNNPEEEARRGIFVPSPLAILADVLTTPWRPESSGYGFALARALLFSHYRIHPPARILPDGWTSLSISEVQDTIETFRIYAKHRDNVHYVKTNRARVFLAHFLAMKGIFVLRFGTAGKATQKLARAKDDCLDFLKKRAFLTAEPTLQARYEFRLAPGLIDIPDTQEILNSLMGIPLLIAGGATVFFEGMQRSHQESLVMSISGSPGTGKTSLALALAASLAPFGTRCLYCTFEEDAETLTRRALAVVPEYFRRTTLLNSEEPTWLNPVTLDPTVIRNVETLASGYVSVLKEKLSATMGSPEMPRDSLPAIAPLFVVIDSLTALLGKSEGSQLEHFCTFVRYLRDLNCIVLLLSADDIPKDSRLEYLVDTVISLHHEGIDSADKKPFRLFRLIKSRLQMSRPGSHLLHLSGERGVRLSPQLPSQLDSHKIHKTPLPDRSRIIDTLKIDESSLVSHRGVRKIDRLVKLYPKAKILIHGHGSSGKAALALKILMAPAVSAVSGLSSPLSKHKRPRILVVSFLYPPEYYDIAFTRLLRVATRIKSLGTPTEMHVVALTPSFIGPEDFIGRVLLEMDRGHLEGWPYTGVLLDGIHNTFLQFPSLQGSQMVWPALYSLLSRYDLTVVTTFTTFAKSSPSASSRRKDDEELILQGQLPFLQVSVQGTDFILQVEPRDARYHDRTFHVAVESALAQRIPRRALIWNADTYTFDRFESLPSSQLQFTLQ